MTNKMNTENRPYLQTVEQVLAEKKSNTNGLSRDEAQARLQQYGPNALPEKKVNRHGCVFWLILTMY